MCDQSHKKNIMSRICTKKEAKTVKFDLKKIISIFFLATPRVGTNFSALVEYV